MNIYTYFCGHEREIQQSSSESNSSQAHMGVSQHEPSSQSCSLIFNIYLLGHLRIHTPQQEKYIICISRLCGIRRADAGSWAVGLYRGVSEYECTVNESDVY